MRRVAFALLAALACLSATRPARADAAAAREKFLADGDAKALAAALRLEGEPALAAFADFAADPEAREIGAPGGSTVLVATIAALRSGSLLGAREPSEGADRHGVPGLWLHALVAARRGDSKEAQTEVAEAPPAAGDALWLALLGLALPPLDRATLARLAEGAVARAAAAGRLTEAAAIGEGAVRVDPVNGVDALVAAARALRRAGKALDALNLLVGPAATRAGVGLPALRLDRAISRRRVGDAAGAAGEAKAVVAPLETAWAFTGLSRAAGAAPQVPGPAPVLGADADAAALAHLAACLGAAIDPDEVSRKAKARGVGASDATFVRETLGEKGLASVEVAGDPDVVIGALSRGTPVLLRRIARRGPRAAETSVVLRAHDAACGLCFADPSDLADLDLVPDAWLAKARATIAVPAARASDLDALRASPAGRLGALLAEAVASPSPEKAAASLLARSADFPGRPVLDVYAARLAGGDAADATPAAAAVAYAALSRGAAAAPRTAAECVALAEARNDVGDVDGALALLSEARRSEGDGVDLRLLEFGVLTLARRRPEAAAALAAATARAPLDGRALLFEGAVRADQGDVAGARAAWRRCLDARPDHAGAAEALVDSLLREGDTREALAAVERYEAALPKGSTAATALRRRAEVRALDAARGWSDLVPYLASPLVATRVDVAGLLSRFEPRWAEAALRGLLSDSDETVRRRAVAAYGHSTWAAYTAADPAAFRALVGASVTDASPAVREAATAALARVPGDPAEAAVLSRFGDASPAVRAATADALFGRDDPRVRAALVAALADDDAGVRRTVARTLTSIAGTDRGFAADAPPDRRAAAIASWKAWLAGK